jgi:hypothetical protein
MKNPIDNFDYRIGCDDFFLYELGRLIDEDRASLEDAEFRRLIETGIHEHIERRLEIRAEIAAHLRKFGATPMIRLIENIEATLRDVPLIVHSYTAYLFRKLEACADEKLDDKVEAAADLLLSSPDDRDAAEMALTTLGSTQSAVSARVLAHLVSEPILEEDLEMKAYGYARTMWPLARPYILYLLKPHTHEDIPFRWFQLFVDCDEPSTVDRILEEILVHAQDPNYREDLLALLELLAQTKDPAAEAKILQVLNSDAASRGAREVLEGFLRNTKPLPHRHSDAAEPWKSLAALYAANEKYLAAAKLFDSGRKVEAGHKLKELLNEHPRYPLAIMLKQVLASDYPR